MPGYILKISFFLIIFILLVPSLYSQQLFPDRHEQSEPPDITEKNTFDIESGLLYQRDNSSAENDEYHIPELKLSYGLSGKIELRLLVNFIHTDTKSQDDKSETSGFSPLTIGSKMMLYDGKGYIPKTALLLDIALPKTGAGKFQVSHFSPSTSLLFQNDLNSRMNVRYNTGIIFDSDDGKDIFFYTLSTGISPFNRVTAFAETYGFYSGGNSADNRIDFGVSFLALNNLQFDTSFGVGISEMSPDFFIYAGFNLSLP